MANKTVSNLNELTTAANSDVLLVETATETLKITKKNLLKEVNEQLNAKSDVTHDHSEYVTEGELNAKGLATETYVQEKIAEASLSGGEVDLSGYATEEYVNIKVAENTDKITVLNDEMQEVKLNVSKGKTLIASAITDKGVTTSDSDSFQQMAINIQNISQVVPTYGSITVEKDSIYAVEGGSGVIKVKLVDAPTVNQTITIYKNNESVNLNQTSLTFTPSNWNVYQEVVFTISEDENMDDEEYLITLTSKSVENRVITIYVEDNDIPTIDVDSIKLNKELFTVSTGDIDYLTAIITPGDATNQVVVWESENDCCELKPNGLSCEVVAKSAGTCIITVTTEDGGKSATCEYTIEEKQDIPLDIRYLTVERAEEQLKMPTHICEVDTANIGEHNDVVHPSVLFFKNGWNGYKYWMAINPYPKTQSKFENPCMIVSNDGDNWETIGDVPIYGIPDGAVHNSDCHIFMDGNTMVYLNRAATSDSCIIEYFTSEDGENWSERQTMIEAGGHNYLSPSIIKFENKYYMFVYDHSLTGIEDYSQRITVLESETLNGSWTKANTILCPHISTIWHLEVKQIENSFYGLITSGSAQGGELYLINLETPHVSAPTEYAESPIVFPSGTAVETTLYKSSMVKVDNGEFEIFVNSKTARLDSFTHWTLNRTKLKVAP
ncbi:MAG: Ig-like domain-containing protein, partial [Turicibacter sp.]|nr:Ig-like domain-containing protein [Turicibacter sp.]